jgi:hypothetical protein
MATVGCNSCHEKHGGVSATGQIKWQICRKSGALVSRHLIASEQFGVCAFEVRTVFDHIHRVFLSFSEAPRLGPTQGAEAFRRIRLSLRATSGYL